MTIEVTQEDREAAWVQAPYPFIIAMKITKEGWMSGRYDHNRL